MPVLSSALQKSLVVVVDANPELIADFATCNLSTSFCGKARKRTARTRICKKLFPACICLKPVQHFACDRFLLSVWKFGNGRYGFVEKCVHANEYSAGAVGVKQKPGLQPGRPSHPNTPPLPFPPVVAFAAKRTASSAARTMALALLMHSCCSLAAMLSLVMPAPA